MAGAEEETTVTLRWGSVTDGQLCPKDGSTLLKALNQHMVSVLKCPVCGWWTETRVQRLSSVVGSQQHNRARHSAYMSRITRPVPFREIVLTDGTTMYQCERCLGVYATATKAGTVPRRKSVTPSQSTEYHRCSSRPEMEVKK